MTRIVVGVDGSPESLAALRWAADEARLRGATLDVVFAYRSFADYYGMSATTYDPSLRERADQIAQTGARRVLDDSLAAVAPGTDVEVRSEAVEGRPATVLLGRSEHADLLVVGSRGHDGFTGLLLGSVSQQSAQHASCPVVVVPPGADAR